MALKLALVAVTGFLELSSEAGQLRPAADRALIDSEHAGGGPTGRAGGEQAGKRPQLLPAGSRVRVVLAPVRLGKVEDFGQILPAEPSFRVDAEALSGRMRLRRGRVVAGYEEAGAGLLSADRHVRELAGFFGRVRWSSATRSGRRGQAHPAKS